MPLYDMPDPNASKLYDLPKGDKPSSRIFDLNAPPDLDPIIATAATNKKIDPALLRAVGEQESGLGKTLDAQHRGDHGHGYGIFQLDDQNRPGQHPRDPALLQKAASDPAFAADYAAGMLSDGIAKYGTIRRALAAYNAGSPESPQGLAYADQVLKRMPPQVDATKITQNAPAAHAGYNQANILGQTGHLLGTVYDAANHGKMALLQAGDEARRHPVEAFSNAMSTLQRGADSLAVDMIHHKWTDPKAVLGDFWHAVMTPQDNQKLVNALELAITHDVLGMNVHPDKMTGIGKFIADLAAETASDPLTYIPVADFFTVGGRAIKMIAAATHSKGALEASIKAMGPIAQMPGMRKLLSRLSEFQTASGALVKNVNKQITDLGARRQELDKFLTPLGKQARMGIEGAAGYHASRRAAENSDILKRYASELKGLKYGDKVPPEVQRHQLMEVWKYGTASDRQEAEALLNALHAAPNEAERKAFPEAKGYIDYEGKIQDNYVSKVIPKKWATGHTSDSLDALKYFEAKGSKIKTPFAKPVTEKIPPELADLSMYDLIKHRLTLGNEAVRRKQIAHETAKLVSQYGEDVMHASPATGGALHEWMERWVPDRPGKVSWDMESKSFRRLSDTFKLGILGNPLPHGLVNVGVVTLFRSNPYVVGRGLLYALKGVPKELDARLEGLGGKTSYWRDASTVPFVVPKAFEASQAILDKLETGYRASYLQHLDRTMGVLAKDDPNFLLHELVKGNKVNHDIGDYANPTKLVQYMKAVGGLYDSFRLDVVPRAAWAATKGRTGQTINLAARGQEEFSQDFMPQGSHLDVVGPLDDFTRMIYAPWDYATSTATIGPVLGGLVAAKQHESSNYESPLSNDLMWVGNYIIPGFGNFLRLRPTTEQLPKGKVAGFNPRKDLPGWMRNEYDASPYWVKFWMEAVLGGYVTHDPSARSEKMRRKGYERALGQ